MNIAITPKAESFIRRMIRFSGGASEAGFRLVVSPGGCSGFNSSFTVESAPAAGDAVISANGVNVFLPAESRILLEGVTIDFSETATSTGLTFINPNSPGCACSSSGDQSARPGTASVSVAAILRKP